MTFEPLGKQAAATQIEPRARLKVMHPNHTGMVLDQLTLLYVPLRIITDMEVRQGEERVFAMKGSIALSQNPVDRVRLPQQRRRDACTSRRATAQGVSWTRNFPIGQGS